MRFESLIGIQLWLVIINLGIALGAGIYEARIEFPLWLERSADGGLAWNAEAARRADSGLRFWAFVTTGPLTLLTLAGLATVWRTRGKVRKWWLVSLGAVLIDRGMTFAYFIPTMMELMGGNLAPDEATAMAGRWGELNHLRHAATFVALLAAMKAFGAFHASKGGRLSA
jgi:hypothetical protein